ncbi:hypothetical protein VH1807_contig00052-0097 [Vibrio harveyi]|nr:hypothetical protein VH1807_contig00052-0097 [Vibrio harveyi]
MIDLAIKTGVLLLVVGGFPYVALNIYLSIKLRKRKYEIIHSTVNCAPFKFRERAKFILESNISWVFASSTSHILYAYIMLRYAWRIPKAEIQEWRQSIKSIYGSDYPLFRFSTVLINMWLTGLPVLFLIAFRG